MMHFEQLAIYNAEHARLLAQAFVTAQVPNDVWAVSRFIHCALGLPPLAMYLAGSVFQDVAADEIYEPCDPVFLALKAEARAFLGAKFPAHLDD